MNFRASRKALALSLLLGGFTAAHAAPETIASTPAVSLYIIGAGEEDALLEQQIARIAQLDTPTTSSLTEYITSDGNHRLYIFRSSLQGSSIGAPSQLPAALTDPNLGALSAVPDGTVVAIHKYSAGGAIQSTAPVANRVPAPKWIKSGQTAPAGTSAPVTVLTTVGATSNITFQKVTFSSALSAANVEQRRPDIGLTTVEPAAFLGRSSGTVKNPDNSTYASYTVLRRDISALTGVVPTADLVNGLVVTKALRDALQRAQGLTVGSELEADVPSLTNAQINALFTQSIVDWSNLLVGATGTPLTSVAGVTAPASTKVFVVRRDNGSGNQIGTEGFFTQGQFNWAAATTGDTDTGLTTVPAGPFVFSGTNTRANQDTFRTLNTNNVWAIGLLSTEKPNLNSTTSGTSRENGYRFIAVNGATPSLVNVVKGRYPIYNTTSVVYNTAFLKTRPLGVQYLAAAVTRGLNNPGLLGPVGENLQINLASGDPTRYWGGGFLVSSPSVDSATGADQVPGTGVPTAGSVLLNPINPNSKQVSGSIKNGGPSVLLYPSPQ